MRRVRGFLGNATRPTFLSRWTARVAQAQAIQGPGLHPDDGITVTERLLIS